MDVHLAQRPSVAALLAPKNVVLVGASDRREHWSGRVWQNLARFGFAGTVYPVNPSRPEIWGTRCYATLADLPEPPDHLALFTPADTSLDILIDAAKLGARSATLYAAGFGEGGDAAGLARAARLRRIVEETGIAIAGPNAMGIASGRSRLVTFADETLEILNPGPVALLTQSGAMCATLVRALGDRGLAVTCLVSCGNQTGLGFADYIEHLLGDPDIRVVLCYIEAVVDPTRFFAIVAQARAAGKEIVAVKIGGSEESRQAALSHTGALAGSLACFNAYADEAGIIRAESLEVAVEAVEFAARMPLPRGPRLAFMTMSGALKSLITDAAAARGLETAALAPATETKLRAALGADADIGNPLDTKRTLPTETYMGCVSALGEAPEIDLLLVHEELPREAGIERKIRNIKALEDWAGGAPIPLSLLYPVALRDSDYAVGVRHDIARLPILRDLGKSLDAVAALIRVGARRDAPVPAVAPLAVAASWRAAAAQLAEPAALNEVESKRLVAEYGIRLPREELVGSAMAAVAAARRIGFPLVMKAVSRAVSHKSDAGLVLLGLEDEAAIGEAAARLRRRCERLGAPLEGLLVSEQITGGIEMVLGVQRDPEMGPVVMVGAGGIWLELMRDVAFAVPRLDRARALAAIDRLAAAGRLRGHRGAKADITALADAMVGIGRLACDLGDALASLDINPLLVREEGVVALDALAVLRPCGGAA
jgi:acyl-CoA synthetase (NDP forming)